MSLLEIEDNIRKKPGIANAVKGLAIIVLGAAAISGAFASYQSHQEATIQSVQECVQLSINNGKEAAIKYSETGAAVFSQSLSENMSPVARNLQEENSFSSHRQKTMSTGGGGQVYTKEERAAISDRNHERAQFNLTNVSEKTTSTLTEACQDSSFRDNIKINTGKLERASADADAGMSKSDIDAKHYEKGGHLPEMLKVDREAIKAARESGQTPDIQVKVRLLR